MTANLDITLPDSPVLFPAASPFVLGTAYLGWAPGAPGAGGVEQMYLSSASMLKTFGERLSGSRATPADLAFTGVRTCA